MPIVAIIILSLSAPARERLIILNEGNWQADNGRLSYFDNGKIISNQWFRDVNGFKLGDTPNDIIQINDGLLAIAVNWSNLIQFINPEGNAVATTEDIPNNRRLATDGRYLYVSSYGHECETINGNMEFTKGYVAKIDTKTFKVIAAVEVGYEPEGIALYNGKLFVANTGGYSAQEDHDYESTISVIDANTMQVIRTVDTGQINLYGKMTQSGEYLCVNSPGDYYKVPAAIVIVDCKAILDNKSDNECVRLITEMAATYSTTDRNGNIFALGSSYSFQTGRYEFNYSVINPFLVFESNGAEGIDEDMPGTLMEDLKNLSMPYSLYINPYSGYIYATDAASFAAGGTLYQWDPEGVFIGKHKVYINPGTIIALKDGVSSGILESVSNGKNSKSTIYNLQGMPVSNPINGEIYIVNGKKIKYIN